MTLEDIPAAQAEHLTCTLRQAGVLGAASVRAVALEPARTTIISRIVRIRLTYDRPAADAPASLIMKTGLPERTGHGWEGVRNELAFYAQVASAMSGQAVPRCYEGHLDEQAKIWHLILEDLTDSHFVLSPWPLPPTIAQCERMVEARARFQAAWWGDPRLGSSVGLWRDDAARVQLLKRFAEALERFFDQLGDNLSAERRRLYNRFLDAAPRLSTQYRLRHKATVVQGDAHPWNCFFPRNAGPDIRFFDWDAWQLDLGASDLAHMMAVQWYPEQRSRMEQRILDRYHAALVEHGVRGYDRASLADDYRFCTLCQIAWPVWQARYGIPPYIWWNNLERVMLAVDDLGCRELLA